MFQVRDVISTFSSKSANWDNKKHFIASKKGTSRRLAKILPEFVNSGMSVLDIGSGSGKIIRELIRLSHKLEITALDASYQMALNLRQNQKLSNVHVLLSDAQNMCFRNHSFDLVTSQQAIHHIPDPFLTLQEINRVLKPNGSALILTVGDHYQDDIFPYEGRKMTNDLLGRINVEELYTLIKGADLQVFTMTNDFFEMKFENFNDYYKFMDAIGSVNKIFNYKAENVSNFEKKLLFFNQISQMKNISYNQPFSINGHYITVIAKKPDTYAE